MAQTGNTGTIDTGNARINVSGGAVHTDSGVIPSTQKTPDVGGTPTPEVLLDASATNEVIFARFTVNATADATAITRLTTGQGDVGRVFTGDSVLIKSDTAITTLHVVGLGDATGTNVMIYSNATESVTNTAHNKFTFESTDNVKNVVISITPSFTSGQLAILSVEGY